MDKGKGIALILGFGLLGAGVAFWLSQRKTTVTPAGGPGTPVGTGNPPPTTTPAASTVATAAVKTVQVVEDLLKVGAPVAAATVAAPVIAGTASVAAPVVAGTTATVGAGASAAVIAPIAEAPAAGAAVGGAGVAGSVASTADASAAIGATTPAGAATSGGSGGLSAFLTNPITIGVAAAVIVGVWIWRARRNETKGDREDFAESLGYRSDSTGTQLDHLFTALITADPVRGPELRNRALNVIGKHDTEANTQWMRDVMEVLNIHPSQAPPLPYDAPLDDDTEKPLDEDMLLEV